MLGVSPRPLPGVSASSENKQRVGASEQRAHNLVGVHMLDFCVFGPPNTQKSSICTLTRLWARYSDAPTRCWFSAGTLGAGTALMGEPKVGSKCE